MQISGEAGLAEVHRPRPRYHVRVFPNSRPQLDAQRAAELVAQLDAHWHTSVLERKLSCKDFEGLRPCRAPRKLNVACTALQYCCIGYCAACLRRA